MSNSKYFKINEEIRKLLEIEISEIPDFTFPVTLTNIGKEALLARDKWPSPPDNRRIGWNWENLVKKYRRNHRNRLELAIWDDTILCGLAIGKLSKGKLVVKINFIEGSSSQHRLKGKIVPIIIRFAELFAVYNKSKWVGIQDPVEDLKSYYKSFGFTLPDLFDPRNNALYKKVEV